MSLYDCSKDLVHDLTLDNQELRSQLEETRGELLREQRRRVDLQARLGFAEEKLRGRELSTFIRDDGTCAECARPVDGDYDYCPWCGRYVDEAQGGDWYEDEGASYFKREVLDPVREMMRR